ncbi:hypothetical protein SMACR_07959 [Sordaria macrospora]|uniref:WGS project CABT00000000 data, contig 2.48 n=2 Tax=Sordaria macrospora TaxID=5147 RepID=F7W909_SORMK|nr:uncharacterized protein SMAC_07959 [Sordaria macrospora k-hell]KAA8631959.1 hypothetical protein SMACR_07959 [Sordaria macrospora]KAH7632359.1 hypothetical protein B0T09DRAFT_394331 [Sordaria sp. MPI-SDFR-AT-0083]WPJ61140.1 hypothetical protein SMAC4_07959 [Sordaria macrospora]CCC13890.1 unnamed protein product [Sordaria macrospora k-hell]
MSPQELRVPRTPQIRNDEEFENFLSRIQATETWRYISGLARFEFMVPNLSHQLVALFEQPRRRDLPPAWKNRLAVEKLSFAVKNLVIYFLTGDDVPGGSYLCSLLGANCLEQSITVAPAMESVAMGSMLIQKAGAFPLCVLFTESSGTRKCCNGVYRNSNSAMMPPVWLPPASAPVNPPMLPSAAPPAIPPTLPPPSSLGRGLPQMLPSASSPACPPRGNLRPPFSQPLAHRYTPSYSPPPAQAHSSTPAPAAFIKAESPELPTVFGEAASRQPVQEAPAQQESALGFLTGTWEERREPLYRQGPGNISISYAHPAGWLQDHEGHLLPTGINGISSLVVNLDNPFTPTRLPSDSRSLVCTVHEGTLEVIMDGAPVFNIGCGSQWTVGARQACRVRNVRVGAKAVLYIVGISSQRGVDWALSLVMREFLRNSCRQGR